VSDQPTNRAVVEGELTRDPKAGAGERGPWAFFSIRPTGEKGIVECSAYGDCAATIGGLGKGAVVRVLGRIGSSKDKRLTEAMKKDVWVNTFVSDKQTGGDVRVIRDAAPAPMAAEESSDIPY
jgi:hypothetical protein